MSDRNFDSAEDYPKVKWMSVGDQFVNVTIIYSDNGTDQYRKTENVEEVVEAVKKYESSRQDIQSKEGIQLTIGCKDELDDKYENLISELNPYKRFELEGILEKDNEGNYFLGGYNTPIPEELADLLMEYYEDGLQDQVDSLVRFWEKALLNPNPEAREGLFEYISNHGITITDHGNMLLYKAVTTKDKRVPDDDLAQFVGSEYLKRKSWGKNPADYYVYKLDEEVILPNNHSVGPGLYVSTMNDSPPFSSESNAEDVEYLGNLAELHDNVEQLSRESETVMTDKHTRTFEYNLGEVHQEDREECDSDPSRGCSTGLHVGSYDYVSSFGHSPYKDIIQATLVNPMNVVAIPNHDSSKIRTCEFYSYGIMERDEDGNWEQVEGSYINAEEDYAEHIEENLEERLDDLKGNVNDPTDEDTHSDQVKAAIERLVDLRDN